jgi:hypothetical protein
MMHKVVVDTVNLASYLEKGYRVSGDSLGEHIGQAWQLLPQEERESLVLVEIEQTEHQRLNSAPPAYVCNVRAQFMASGAELLKLDCIAERDEHRTLASVENSDESRWFLTVDIAETPRAAVAFAKLEIVNAIAEHRRIADELTSFLQGMECL